MEILEIIQTVGAVLKIIETVIQVLAPVIQKIGQSLGLIDEGEKSEDLGGRALNAEDAGIRPEEFGSFEEYLQEVKKFPPETDKPIEDRLKKGAELVLGVLAEKYPGLETEVFATLKDLPELTTVNWGAELGKLLKSGDLNPIAVSDFFLKRSMSDNDRYKVMDSLIGIEKKNNPSISDSEAMEKISKVRD